MKPKGKPTAKTKTAKKRATPAKRPSSAKTAAAATAKAGVKSVDAYLAAVSSDKRAALQQLRKNIRAIVPTAEECISYQLPAFRLDGKMLVWYGAAANHCAFYPGAVIEAHAADLADYDVSKGTIRFQPDHPLPAPLVRRLVEAKIAQRLA